MRTTIVVIALLMAADAYAKPQNKPTSCAGFADAVDAALLKKLPEVEAIDPDYAKSLKAHPPKTPASAVDVTANNPCWQNAERGIWTGSRMEKLFQLVNPKFKGKAPKPESK